MIEKNGERWLGKKNTYRSFFRSKFWEERWEEVEDEDESLMIEGNEETI